MKRVLCIAYSFPPVADSGTHRTRALVRYLPAHGWCPIVLTACRGPASAEDMSLLEGLPDDLVVFRTHAPDLLSLADRLRSSLRGESRPQDSRAAEARSSQESQLGVGAT